MLLLRSGPFSRLQGPALVLLAVLALSACGQEEMQSGGGAPPPPSVTVMEVSPETVQESGEYAGRVRGSRQVEVRAQVGGILEERLYEEGQEVEQGDPMFRIEQEPFEIAVQRAEAERADARANLNQAEREWRRVSGLYEQNAVSERERDQALSQLELAQAHFALAEAGVAQAKLELSYTLVRAPISGVTGLETLSEGSLIDRGTLLTSVTQQDPVYVYFALPQTDAAAQRLARSAMANSDDEGARFPAELLLPDGTVYEQEGAVDFTDSTIDPRTGNVSARAVFPNPERGVIPGQFVRVRVGIQQLEDVFAVDQQAVGQGPEGPQVFVVDGEDTAHARPVQLGPVVDGKQVVREGLETGDRLVVNGQVALQDGIKVAPQARNGQEG